jgi:hypothetical protein
MRVPALAGSLAVHCAIALAIVVLLTDTPPAGRTGSAIGVAVEVIDSTPPLPRSSAPALPAPPVLPAGDMHSQVAEPPRAPSPAHRATPRSPGTPPRADDAARPEAVETTMRMEQLSEAGGREAGGGSSHEGDDTGDAEGHDARGGPGRGIGLGNANGLADLAAVASLPLPVPPRVSLARPPKLIWPTREGPTVESELYVARLRIDADGLVDGVRLIRRFRVPRDDDAEAAVWTFRYLPALDDDGHPTPATIEQSFMVRVR